MMIVDQRLRLWAYKYILLPPTASVTWVLQLLFGPWLQDRMRPSVKRAFGGLDHSVYRLSGGTTRYATVADAQAMLNEHAEAIGRFLPTTTLVENNAPVVPSTAAPMRLGHVTRRGDAIRTMYIAPDGAVFNASITYGRAWSGEVDGRHAAVLRGNVSGIAVVLSPGRGELVLTYRSWIARLFVITRAVEVFVGVIVVVMLGVTPGPWEKRHAT